MTEFHIERRNLLRASGAGVLGTTGLSTAGAETRASAGDPIWEYATALPVYSSPTVVDGTVFIGDGIPNLVGSVYALDAASGQELWTVDTGGEVRSSPAVVDGTVFVGSNDGSVYALAADTGAQQWTVGTGGVVESSPTVTDSTVFVGSDDGSVYALAADTGAQQWTVATGGAVESSPTVVDGTVVVGSNDGSVYALDAASGQELWTASTGGPVRSSPTVADGTVFVGSDDGSVYALAADTGAQQWTVNTGGPVESSPTVTDGTVFVGSNSATVYALDAASGTEVWTSGTDEPVVSSPTVAGGAVFVGGTGNSVYALAADTGTQQWVFDAGGTVYSSPTVVDGRVFVGVDTPGNEVYALDAGAGGQSEGSRVNLGTLGHHHVWAGADPPASTQFVVSPPVPVVDTAATFDASPTGGDVESFAWAFGDGETASGAVVTHSYDSTGTYEVTLTVERPDGTETTTRTVDVGEEDNSGDSGITAAFDYSPQQPNPGTEVTLDATPSSGTDIDEYVWDFGDGETADGIETTHTYDDPGEYDITLQVLAVPQGADREVDNGQLVAPGGPDRSGTTDEEPIVVDTATATALVGSSGGIGFTVSELEPATNETVQFDSGLGASADPEWAFGDGTTATGPAASHQYDDPGNYTVTLTASGETATRELTVGEPPVEIEAVEREIDGTLLPNLGLDETFEASVTTPPDRELSHVEFAFTDQSVTAQSPPYEAAFPVGDLGAPAEPLGVTAVTVDGASHETAREVPVQQLPGWLEFLLEVVSDVAVEFDGEEISISYAPLADLAADLGLPDVVVGGDESDASGDGAYDLGVGFGGMYNPLTNQAELTAQGDIAADLMQLAFDISVGLVGELDIETLELLAATANVDSQLEFDVQPPAVPIPISIPIPLTSASIGVVPVVVVTADGTFDFDGNLGFDEGTVEPGIALEIELGISLPEWVPGGGELLGVPSGGIEGSFDVGTDDWNVQATFVLAGEIILDPPLIPSVTLEQDPIWELPVLGGDADLNAALPNSETVVRQRQSGGPQPLPDVPGVDARAADVGTSSPRETVRLTDRPYQDISPAVASVDADTQLAVWAQQDEDKPAEAGHDIVVRWYEGGQWGEQSSITDDETPHGRPVCAATGGGGVLAVWEQLDADLSEARLETPADVADLRDQSEIAYSIYDPTDGWSSPETLTDTGLIERRPTVTAGDGTWLLAWEQRDPETDARTVRSTVVSPDGTVSEAADRANASVPDTGSRQDGRTDLAYIDWNDGPTGVTHEILDGETVDESQQYDTPEALEVVVSDGRVVWVEDPGRDPALVKASNGQTDQLDLREEVAEVREPSLTARDGEVVLSYLARLAEREDRTMVYRLDRGDGWIRDRDVTTDEIHDGEALRLRYTDMTFAGPTALLSAYSLREPGTEPVGDVFATHQEYGPAYGIDGEVTSAPAGEETELSYTLANRGDVGGSEPVTVSIERDGEELLSTTHDPLDSGAELSATQSVVVGEGGQFAVLVEVPEPSLGPEPGSVTLTAARADLRVAAVSADRVASDEATVAVTIENAGGARTTEIPVELVDADGPVTTVSLDEIEPAGTGTVEATVDPTALDTADTHAVRIDPDGTLPDRHQTGEARRTHLVKPGLGVEDVRYRTDDTGPFARVLVSNTGPGDGTAPLTIVDGADEILATRSLSIPPAGTVDGQQVPTYRSLDVRVPDLEPGVSVTVELSPTVSNLRQEPLEYIDTVETILPGEFDQGLPSLPGYDRPPQDLDADGRYEDIDGDGAFDIFDVQALFKNLDSDPVQDNPDAFNFNEDTDPEGVSIFDVQGLFNLLNDQS